MTVIRNNSISGINSITAQSASLNFYDTSGNTLSIGASVTGNVTGNLTGNVNAGVVTATSSIVVGDSFINPTSIGIGTTDTTGRNAGVGTAVGTIIFNSSLGTGVVQVFNGSSWVDIGANEYFEATGGTLDSSSRPGYNIHTFTSPGTFTVTSGSKNVEYLVVGGGGGGGSRGGGGAGGYRSGTIEVTPGTYPVTRGGGGTGVPGFGGNGSQSIFSTITSEGGGGGAPTGSVGTNGGSGGGGGGYPGIFPGGTGNRVAGTTTPVPSQGNPGGNGISDDVTYTAGGGGGGAAAAGGNGNTPAPRQGGNGGNGSPSSITGSSTTYAGGGGGCTDNAPPAVGGTGGSGGGGNGSDGTGAGVTSGTANTGGGGGAAVPSTTPGSGGSGIVIIAYPTA